MSNFGEEEEKRLKEEEEKRLKARFRRRSCHEPNLID